MLDSVRRLPLVWNLMSRFFLWPYFIGALKKDLSRDIVASHVILKRTAYTLGFCMSCELSTNLFQHKNNKRKMLGILHSITTCNAFHFYRPTYFIIQCKSIASLFYFAEKTNSQPRGCRKISPAMRRRLFTKIYRIALRRRFFFSARNKRNKKEHWKLWESNQFSSAEKMLHSAAGQSFVTCRDLFSSVPIRNGPMLKVEVEEESESAKT